MLATFFAFAYALIIFALAGEADTPWLRVLGFVAGIYLTIAGALSGWLAARE